MSVLMMMERAFGRSITGAGPIVIHRMSLDGKRFERRYRLCWKDR